MLCQSNTADTAFFVSGKIGRIILKESGQQYQADTHHAACHIKWNFPTGNTPVHQIADQVI